MRKGDVVRSWFPGTYPDDMTIEGIEPATVKCVWFDDEGELHRESFLETSVYSKE